MIIQDMRMYLWNKFYGFLKHINTNFKYFKKTKSTGAWLHQIRS
jgi:hypothetical protein